MSDAGKAVFLSYASQDTEAAKRICESLRQAAVEVWFDADGGLEHGDEWDAKIRRQIKECVLFIPIISANTQAREEGYFRLEWDLAAERARTIASGVPFILPVVIDDTREPDALVPDRFRTVQWTRLPGGVVTPEVKQRFLKLWSHRIGAAKHQLEPGRPHPGELLERGGGAAPSANLSPRRGIPTLAWAIGLAVVAVLAGALGQRLLQRGKPASPAATAARSFAPVSTPAASEADQLVARAYALIERLNYTRDNLAAADDLARKATELANDSAGAWAARAFVQSSYIHRGWDLGQKRREDTQALARRSLALNPDEPDALLALTYVLNMQRAYAQAETHMRRAVALRPGVFRYHAALVAALGGQGRDDEAFALSEETVRLFPREPLAGYALAGAHLRRGRFEEALAHYDAAIELQPFAGALLYKTVLLVVWRGDVPAARATLDRLATEDRPEDRAVAVAMWLGLVERQPARVHAAAALTAREFFEDAVTPGPKAWSVALAHRIDQKESLARQQWQAAEAVLRQRLREQPAATDNQARLATTLAWLDRSEEAAREIAPFAAAAHEQPGVNSSHLLAQYFAALGDAARAAPHLARAMDRHRFVSAHALRLDPQWDKLRGQPGFEALLTEAQPRTESTGRTSNTSGPGAARTPDSASAKSVAVLPFANLSADKDNEYFSDGIAEELLTTLQKIPGLRVAARTSAWSFKGKNPTLKEVGEVLGMAHVVEGSVQKSGNRVRITARLSRAATNEELWSQSFGPLELTDVFVTQTELAQAIVRELRGRLTGATGAVPADVAAEVQAATRGGTKNVEAHQLYLQGKYLANQFTLESLSRAEGLLRQAVKLDPQFALAWAALAQVGSLRSGYEDTRDLVDASFALASEASRRALVLAPDLAAAQLARSGYQMFAFDWKGAAESLRRAAALAPDDPAVLYMEMRVAHSRGEMETALEAGRRAVALDPVNPALRSEYGLALAGARRYVEAIAECRRTAELSPTAPWGHAGVSLSLLEQGRFDEAAAEALLESTDWCRLFALALARWGQGKKTEAEAAAAELEHRFANVAAFQLAQVYAYRGESDRAFAWLERAHRQRDPGLIWTRADPLLARLHADPRWPALLRQLGLHDEQLR
jgi:TolB-like protein/predicted Zn-dependent protease